MNVELMQATCRWNVYTDNFAAASVLPAILRGRND
jgi:hypothetical protein